MLFFNLDKLIIDGPEAARAANKQDFFDLARMNQVQNQMDLANTQQPGALAAAQVESDTIGTAAQQLYQQNAIPTLAQGRSDSLMGTAAVQSLQGNYNQAAAAASTPLIPQLTSLRALTELQNARNAQNQAAAIVPLQQQVAVTGLQGQQQLVPLQTELGVSQLNGAIAAQPLVNNNNLVNQGQIVPAQQNLQMGQIGQQSTLLPLQTSAEVNRLQNVVPAQQAVQVGQAQQQQTLLPLQTNSEVNRLQSVVPAQQRAQVATSNATERVAPQRANAEVNRLQSVVPVQQAVQIAQGQQQQTLIPQQTTAESNRLQNVVPAQQSAQVATSNATERVAPQRANAEVNRLQTVVPAQQIAQVATAEGQAAVTPLRTEAEVNRLQNVVPAQQNLTLSTVNSQLNSAEQRQQNATAQRSAQIAQAQLRQRTAHARTALLDIGSLNQRPDPMTARRISQSLVSSGLVPPGSTVTPDTSGQYGVNMPGGTRVNLNAVGSQIQSQLTNKNAAAAPPTEAPNIDLSALLGTGKVAPLGPQKPTEQQVTISPETIAEWRREDSPAWRMAQLNVANNPASARLTPTERKAAIIAELNRMIGVWTNGGEGN